MKIILKDRFIKADPELFDTKYGPHARNLKCAVSSPYGWKKDRELHNTFFYTFGCDDNGFYGIGVELNVYGYIWLNQFNSVPAENVSLPIQSIFHYNDKKPEGKVSHRWSGQLKLFDNDDLIQKLYVPDHQKECVEAIKKYWKNSAFVDIFLTHKFIGNRHTA